MSRYLDMVDNPEHVKKLTLDQQKQLAEEIRHELIIKLAKNGGHLGPNLGVVELTLALHSVFTTPKDKFVWDVSHQSYVHKLLTGRKDRFHTIRTTDGLNGFALRTEDPRRTGQPQDNAWRRFAAGIRVRSCEEIGRASCRERVYSSV